jgi:ATP/maltotriose-dependent transcriptional regulator MalT
VDDAAAAALGEARRAYGDRDWAVAHERFRAARGMRALSAEDTAALADAAWWVGEIDESLSACEQAFELYLHRDPPDPRAAAMIALDLGYSWLLRGEEALGSGWIGRAARLLQDLPECVEHGYLLLVDLDMAMESGEQEAARSAADAVLEIGKRYGDETLVACALVARAIAAVRSGRVEEGLRGLDEAMLPVVAGRVRPTYAGNLYCQLMTICHELADVRRAQQWTDATARWCTGFSNAVMFLGVCRVHRAQLLQLRGDWVRAEAEIELVCRELADMNVGAVGLARYELGELRRLRGDLDGAESAFADAHALGQEPHPGLALVWVAKGDTAGAVRSLQSCLASTDDPLARARLDEALVEAALAAGDVAAAQRAADELDAAAAAYGGPGLVAAATTCRGRVLLARGTAATAVDVLRTARRQWQELEAPYRVARVREQLARALAECGDVRGAKLEAAASARELGRLGTLVPTPDVGSAPGPAGLTRRETEVLALVAGGLSNREVADRLVLSERTVARHLANVFVKLGVKSRTAAAAHAHRHGLVPTASA